MLENLIPASENNSLRQVVATIFCQGPLIDPKRYQKFLNKLNYQRFEILKTETLKLNVGDNQIQDRTERESEERGFRMTSFEKGRLSHLIHVEQVENRKKDVTKYSFYSFRYEGWENFKKHLITDLFDVLKEDNQFVQAVSLNYANEFLWKSEDKIPVEAVFNPDAEFISKKFLNSQNTAFLINTDNQCDAYKSIEKVEIGISAAKKMIQINSQLVFEINKIGKFGDLLETKIIEEYFESIHDEIKSHLRQSLTENVKQKINLL